MEYLFWALAGWCGTRWPRRWPWPWPGPGPDPDPRGPQPDPWLPTKLAGIVGGIVGGVVFDRFFEGSASLPARSLGWMAATCVGAFIVGRVLSEIVDFALGAGARRPNA